MLWGCIHFFLSFSFQEKNICVVQSPLKSACINLLNRCIKSEYRNGFSFVGLSPIGDFAAYIFSSFILSLRADSTLPQENCSCCMLWLNLRILGAWRQWCLPEPSLLFVYFGFSHPPHWFSFSPPSTDGGPRETLMHFAARLGLLRLTWFLLQKPGGRGALSIHNQEGATPVSLALERGYHKLHRLLTE